MFMPIPFLLQYLFGPLSLLLLGGSGYLLWRWWELYRRDDPAARDPGDGSYYLAYLITGLALLLLALLGRSLFLLLRPRGKDEPRAARDGTVHRLARPDGSELQVESYGSENAPPIILTHGWGTNSTEWYHSKGELAKDFRVIVWDLPGTGKSKGLNNHDYSPDRFAHDLEAVLQLAGERPAVLVGHSLGGMTTQAFCRLFPQHLNGRVAGLVLVHTTFINPVRTTIGHRVLRALQRPILTPLLYLMIALWPLFWLMNALSYLNGTAHLSFILMGFAGRETRGQLDFNARFIPLSHPGVMARGLLAMFKFNETTTLPEINVPTLVISGDHDPVLLPEASRRIHEGVKGSTLLELKPAKHLGYMEQHERFNEAVRSFVTSLNVQRAAHS